MGRLVRLQVEVPEEKLEEVAGALGRLGVAVHLADVVRGRSRRVEEDTR